jgi:hypothetical protein
VYLAHSSATGLVGPYLNSTGIAQAAGKEFLMFETNTASCGGFVGLSDAFAAALWGVDYGMQMAHANFSGALFHIGGQSVSYNPFTRACPHLSNTSWKIADLLLLSSICARV